MLGVLGVLAVFWWGLFCGFVQKKSRIVVEMNDYSSVDETNSE